MFCSAFSLACLNDDHRLRIGKRAEHSTGNDRSQRRRQLSREPPTVEASYRWRDLRRRRSHQRPNAPSDCGDPIRLAKVPARILRMFRLLHMLLLGLLRLLRPPGLLTLPLTLFFFGLRHSTD